MSSQPDLFDIARGKQLRDAGIETAGAHADAVSENWRERAYLLFKVFAARNAEFMTEDVRAWAKPLIEDPPDMRAWGGVAVRARKAGLIVRHGYAAQKDPKSHRAPGNVWRTVN
jgi:hypothetical protein